IIANHIQDTALVRTQFGCVLSDRPTGDFFIDLAMGEFPAYGCRKLSADEIATLDSLLIYTPNYLWSTWTALEQAKPTAMLYPRVREMAILDSNEMALVALAKFQNEEDIELILAHRGESEFELGGFRYTYMALDEFTHPAFLFFLEQHLHSTFDRKHYSRDWEFLYKAIANYKNEKALGLLQLPFTEVVHQNIRRYHLGYVFVAIQEHQVPLYEPLMWKLWEEEGQINTSVFNYLSKSDPARAFKITKSYLTDMNPHYGVKIDLDAPFVFPAENLTEVMIDLALQQDRDYALAGIADQLRDGYNELFPIFADIAIRLKDPALVEPLFDRLENPSFIYSYLKTAEALMAYEAPAIDQRLREAQKKYKHLRKGEEGKALKQLLEVHNLK
ncbi:MAG: hypothetical protein AAFV80_22555, partial [Bacteroidota bacterium]